MSKKVKHKVNDVFMHKEEKKMYIVTDVAKYQKGNLYTLEELSTKENVTYKRYYEPKMSEKCIKAKNSKAVKVLYGKKK